MKKLVVIPFIAALSGCGLFTPATVPAIGALGACIVARTANDADVTPAMTPLAIVEDVAGYCSTDIATVVASLGAIKAEKERQAAAKDAGK